ncbi:hypothetical protein F4780DRAFT_750792 [Xylariomycetidae sp. FL0641]|nr:hypothetical protein F4780DRAFT_750792 [Xylariomycetidae sp. FL0641]
MLPREWREFRTTSTYLVRSCQVSFRSPPDSSQLTPFTLASRTEVSQRSTSVTQVFEFTDGTFIKNLSVLSDGRLFRATSRSSTPPRRPPRPRKSPRCRAARGCPSGWLQRPARPRGLLLLLHQLGPRRAAPSTSRSWRAWRRGGGPGLKNAYDDFAFDGEGNAYVAVHPASVNRITPDGLQTTVVGTDSNVPLREPTSVVVANDGRSIFVSTGESWRAWP